MALILPPDFDPNCAPTDKGIYGLPTSPDDAGLVVIPVPWEVTASFRAGTSNGPLGIFGASFQVELYDREAGTPYEFGIAIVQSPRGLEDVQKQANSSKRQNNKVDVDALCAKMNGIVQREVREWRGRGKLVGLVGGEHGISLGAIKDAATVYESFGLLQVDAHADLRQSYQGFRYSHASFTSNVLSEIPTIGRIVQVGVRDLCPAEANRIRLESRITTFFDQDYSDESLTEIVEALPQNVWITFDIDGLESFLCPNTGTPVPGGLAWKDATRLLKVLGCSGRRIVGFDLCEVAPDTSSELGTGWDEIVGARLLYKLIGWTILSNAGG